MEKSRTEHSARNATVSAIARMITIAGGFVARIVFTHTLSQDYVGINGLFSDILNMLALSELGLGAAITYALYRPIAQGDVEKQKSLMRMFRNFYRVVAGIVLAGGLAVAPFLGVLIKEPPQVDHLTLIYLLYLCNSVLSYFMVYKRTLIDAHQLSYLGVLFQTSAWLLQNILQIILLLTTRNFILYVSVTIFCTLLNNLAISWKADQLYPFLKDKPVERLPEKDRKEIFRNMRAMLLHKIGGAMVNGTDNLLLSSLVGITGNSLYSNYALIIGSLRQVLNQAFQGITASVGNLGTEQDMARVKRVYEASFFLGQWLFGVVAVCAFEVIGLVVEVCFGRNYVFPREVTLVLCLNFYLTGTRQATLIFRDAMGGFWYDRYKSLVEAVVNLAASIVLGKLYGAAGVFLGTLVSTVTTSLWVEPFMLYRHCLKASPRRFLLRYGLYMGVTFLLWYGEDLICQSFSGSAPVVGALRLLFCFAATNLAYFALYHRTKEFRLLAAKAWEILSHRWKKRGEPE